MCLKSNVLCVLMVDGMSVIMNVMFSLMSVMSPPPVLCDLSVRTVVKLCTLGDFALGVYMVSCHHYHRVINLVSSISPRNVRRYYSHCHRRTLTVNHRHSL